MTNGSGTIVYVLPTFPPSGGTGTLRMVKQIKYLADLGWQVEVITRLRQEPVRRDETLCRDVPGTCRIHRVLPPGGWFRMIPWLVKYLLWNEEPTTADWVVSSSPETRNHLLGWVTARMLQASWHCDLRDPPLDTNSPLRSWLLRRCLRRSQLLTCAWPPESMLPTSLADSRDTCFVRNAYDPDDFIGSGDRAGGDDGCLRIVHTGSLHGPYQDPKDFLDVLDQLIQEGVLREHSVRIQFIGAIFEERLGYDPRNYVREKGLQQHITFQEFQSHQLVTSKLQAADVGLVIRSSPNVPYKFCEYLGAGLPTLVYHVPDSPLRGLVENQKSVHWVNYGDHEELLKKMRSLIGSPVDRTKPSDEFRKEFSIGRTAQTLSEMYKRRVSD